MVSKNHRARFRRKERRERPSYSCLFVFFELVEEKVGEDDGDVTMEGVQRVEVDVFERNVGWRCVSGLRRLRPRCTQESWIPKVSLDEFHRKLCRIRLEQFKTDIPEPYIDN